MDTIHPIPNVLVRVILRVLVGIALSTSIVVAAGKDHPLEPADTSSPRATLRSFLTSVHEVYLLSQEKGRAAETRDKRTDLRRKALSCLDLSEVPPAVRQSVAKEKGILLKEVLDRLELPHESEWPDLDSDPELTKWRIPHTNITIVKIQDGPRKGEFLFSAHTVERVPEFYERVKNRSYVDRATVTPGFYLRFMSEPGWMIPRGWIQSLPASMRSRWMGQAIWQWIGLIGTLLVAGILMTMLYLTGRRSAKRLSSNLPRYLITLIFPITAMLVPLMASNFIIEQLHIYGILIIWISIFLQVVFLAGLVVFLMGLGNRLAVAIIATPWVAPGGLDAQLTRLICRVLSMITALIVLLEGGRNLGIPLATMLTGASIGGLAIALAAQDVLKSIFGSMMVMLDKPYKVGERILVSGLDGVVDEIGLRSTKLRLMNGHEATIANEEMARTPIENIGRSPFIQRTFTVALPSDTSPAKIRRALEILRGALKDHEVMNENFPPRVYLRDVNESSVGIFVGYWYHTTDYWKFLEFGERLNLEMVDQFAMEGISYASPGLNVRMMNKNASDVR